MGARKAGSGNDERAPPCGTPLATARRMFLDPGTLSVVDWGERPVLRLFNAHGHNGWETARWMGI